jgi:cytidylate kinase
MKIAIDGPAGAGKSSVGRAIARAFSCIFVNTGAMYRALALGLERGLTLEQIRIEINAEEKIFLNKQDVTSELYTAEVDELASRAATRAEIREYLIQLQRELAQHKDIVMEGRDIGTVVLPDADVKIFLTASLETRARRRADERDNRDSYEAILKKISERDARDSFGFQRLQITPDTLVIASDGRTLDEVIAEVLLRVSAALQERKKLGKLSTR